MLRKRMLLVMAAVMLSGAVGASQGASLAELLKKEIEAIYGTAPPRLAIVSLPGEVWARIGGARGRGRGGDVTMSTAGDGGGREGSVQGRTTAPGDSATGIIIKETADELFLDGSPCDLKTVGFKKPYRKTPVDTVTCNGKQQQTFKVVQEK